MQDARQESQKVENSKPAYVNVTTEIASSFAEGRVRLSIEEALRILSTSLALTAVESREDVTAISKDTVAVRTTYS